MTFPATLHRPTVAAFLAREIDASDKTQLQITAEVGFDSPNMISMVKQGRTKVPLARVGPLAQALGIDPAYLFRLVMQEYLPDTAQGTTRLRGVATSNHSLRVAPRLPSWNITRP